MTILMEGGEVGRFKTPGDFASYCRTVDSNRMSNGKKKGDNNPKCDNKYLAWAFVEAANLPDAMTKPAENGLIAKPPGPPGTEGFLDSANAGLGATGGAN